MRSRSSRRALAWDLAGLRRGERTGRGIARRPLVFTHRTRKIDATAERLVGEVKAEEMRIARLVGDYQTLELARQRAAEAERMKELQRIEMEKAAAMAQAKSHDELDKIAAEANMRAEALPPPVRDSIRGQVVREDWEITVQDIWALARAHPMCVTITPRLAEIRILLDAGQKVAGVKAEKVVKSGVRTKGVVLDV